MSQYRITATITSQTQATDSGAWQMGITWRKSLTLDLAVSLRAGTVAYNKAPRDNGFAGRTPQPSQPMAQPQPQQPTTPASDPWNATGAQTRQPAFTDGFAPAAPQQPAI